MGSTVKTRILIISDTHCAQLSNHDDNGGSVDPPFKSPLPAADLLIHCGDLTDAGQLAEYHSALDMLKEIEAPVKLVIAGNHDLSLDKDFVFSHIGRSKPGWKKIKTNDGAELKIKQAEDLWLESDGRARKEGVTFLNEGLHEVELSNGAKVKIYASPYTPKFNDFGFPYERGEDRFNPPGMSLTDANDIATNPVPSPTSSNSRIDILMTHGPPYGRLDETARGEHVGCPHLLRALMRSRPLICSFGHIHEGWGAERIRWSHNVDEVASSPLSIGEWKRHGWENGVDAARTIEKVNVDLNVAKEQHSAFLDLSNEGGCALDTGKETILINASIMDLKYNPVNAPWLVDVDLQRAE